ncbi:IniB N-terminal domain-containing protein [Mycobacterium sp. 3519A]|jgi:hypothetical protein|uniref:IniB N-terminal domain-containing protein n=1 Tax=Mycobacterium sp. 3519A TaxID=2057184 RepID=UPI00115C1FA7|nr:IniB N-terminal domain-containing protein [Mycobacterium sp. 3519A]
MANLVDYIMDLFKDPGKAESFVDNPQAALASIGLGNVSPEQIQAVAAMAAPGGAALPAGQGMSGLQQAVASHHGMPAPAPQHVEHTQQGNVAAPITHTSGPSGLSGSSQGDVTHTTYAPQANDLSNHETNIDSHNSMGDYMSPHMDGVQQGGGGFNLGVDVGDVTLGDKNVASGDGAVAMSGDNSGSIVSGDGAVLGDGNTVLNGDIDAGDGSPITFGDGNDTDATSMKAGGDMISGNDGPVLNGVDTGGGSLGLDNSHTVYGDENNTDIGGDIGSIGGDLDTSHADDNSVDNSSNDYSSGHNVDSHDDNSQHNPNVSTDVSADVSLI